MRPLAWFLIFVTCSLANAQAIAPDTESKRSAAPAKQEHTVSLQFYGPHTERLVKACRAADKMNLDRMVFEGSVNEFYDAGNCLGFAAGIVDAETVNGVVQQKRFCVPTSVTGSQLVKVIAKYGDAHPEKLHMPAVWFVFEALEKAFPCE